MSVHLYIWDFVSALWVKEPLINGPYSFRQMLITYILLELCVTITRNND